MARRHDRAPRGQRLRVGVPYGHWKTTTFIGALTLRGFIAPFVIDGAVDRLAFETYVEKVLVPELRQGDVCRTISLIVAPHFDSSRIAALVSSRRR
jgi:hypothetical protein